MYPVNTDRLLEIIEEKGYTLITFTKELGIGVNSFTSYLRMSGRFPIDVIEKAVQLLGLSQNEANRIFFCKQTYVN